MTDGLTAPGKAKLTEKTDAARARAAEGWLVHAQKMGATYLTPQVLEKMREKHMRSWHWQSIAGWNWIMDLIEAAERVEALESVLDDVRKALGLDERVDLIDTAFELRKKFDMRGEIMNQNRREINRLNVLIDEATANARDYQQLRDHADELINENAEAKLKAYQTECEADAVRVDNANLRKELIQLQVEQIDRELRHKQELSRVEFLVEKRYRDKEIAHKHELEALKEKLRRARRR